MYLLIYFLSREATIPLMFKKQFLISEVAKNKNLHGLLSHFSLIIPQGQRVFMALKYEIFWSQCI